MTIVLAHSSSQPKTFHRTLLHAKGPVSWLFFGQDYAQLIKWGDALGGQIRRIALKPELTTVIEQLRAPYLDLIVAMNGRTSSPGWWASRISERNTAISHLFLYCCYLRFAELTVAGLTGTLGVVSESQAVLESLAAMAEQKGIETVWVGKRSLRPTRLLQWPKHLFWILANAAIVVRGRFMGRDAPLNAPGSPSVLLHTYIDESCFGATGTFQDRYFPGLSAWLTQHGYSVNTVPVIFNIRRSYAAAWKWLRKSGQAFINPYRYYRLADFVFAVKESWTQLSLLPERIHLDGMDVTGLFRAEQDRWAFRDIRSILYFRLPKRLAEAGLRVDMLIAEYENMINEKMLIMGFHTYLPSVKLVGFQHGALYPLLLCNFVTREEASFAPLPDRIVCNGELFRSILVREGLPEARAVVGPALRYAYLSRLAPRAGDNPEYVLVPLPMMVSDGAELISKLLDAFGEMTSLQFKLKPHPMTNADVLLKAARIDRFPPHFECVQGKIDEWLPKAKVAVALSSSAVYDIVAAGVPVVVVGRDAGIDLNPLGFLSDLNKVFSSSEDIRKEVLRLIALSPEELDRYRMRGKEVLRMSFTPVTADALRAFVDGLL